MVNKRQRILREAFHIEPLIDSSLEEIETAPFSFEPDSEELKCLAILTVFAKSYPYRIFCADSPRELRRLTKLFDAIRVDYTIEYKLI